MLNAEEGVGHKETFKVEAPVGGQCRVINRREKRDRGRWSALKGPDEVAEAARDHHPDELVKCLTPLSNLLQIRGKESGI
jgi:hypothetical protein